MLQISLAILTANGSESSDASFSISEKQPKPRNILPQTTFDPSRCGESTVITKNWELLVLGRPKLAIPTEPASCYANEKIASINIGWTLNRWILDRYNLDVYLQIEALVLENWPVDAFATGSVVVDHIAALSHE